MASSNPVPEGSASPTAKRRRHPRESAPELLTSGRVLPTRRGDQETPGPLRALATNTGGASSLTTATSRRQTAVLARGATGAGSQGWGHGPSKPGHKAGASHPSNAERHSGALSRLSFLKLPPDAHSGKAEGASRGRRCAGRRVCGAGPRPWTDALAGLQSTHVECHLPRAQKLLIMSPARVPPSNGPAERPAPAHRTSPARPRLGRRNVTFTSHS